MKLTTNWLGGIAAAVTLALLIGIGVQQVDSAAALDGNDFNPGNIITDEKFHDSRAMSGTQIQGFLETRVSTCASGYTCLKDYTQTTWTRAADAQCSSYTGAVSERASSIISKVAMACGINPQVLLVLLQKEQALVTASRPSAWGYGSATGYACPDTAPCAAEFSGFYNQVYKAAWQYRYYENHPSSYRYRKNTVVDVLLHPNSACGTQKVYIENQATANLYIYTPYGPNTAALDNLYGIGDACSSYGNRNFWRIFVDWFGASTGPKSVHGSLDRAAGVAGGIQITGWAVDPFNKTPAYVWVDVDGAGGPILANAPLSWIEGLYPGYGQNHGFDRVVPASPGNHRVCVSQTNGTQIGCANVQVPDSARAAGTIESVVGSQGSIAVTGWSVDKTSSVAGYVWINVDGVGRAHKVDVNLPWTATAFPGTGSLHGFDVSIPASPGDHTVCAYGVDSVLLACRNVVVPPNEVGAFETASAFVGGIDVAGWSLNQTTKAATYVWVTVDGVGAPLKANQPSASATAAHPGVTGPHGFAGRFAAKPGERTVCVTGTSENRSYGCRTVIVPNNEVGHVDSIAGVMGGVTLTGWSLDQTSSTSTYVWVTIDGRGTPVKADQPLSWMNDYYPGTGPNHGFSATLPATPGTHRVCVTGTKEQVSLGCTDVLVPSSAKAHVDGVVGVPGGIRVTGWAVDTASTRTMYVWADVDGSGTPIAATKSLPWINSYFPGVGDKHGFDVVIAAPTGSHRVCLTLTEGTSALGCTPVQVP
ncbi:MAG: hypothetical protein H7288_09135 [Kineosporiaceae bacterium]|nr:hypothetical protein [Aeromicrobium sp.]